jgi:excisionase family DNA binding protein
MNRNEQIPGLIKGCGGDERSPVLTLKETAEYLGISKAHLSNVINRRVPGLPALRHAKIGRRTLIKREWADQWLEKAAQQ